MENKQLEEYLEGANLPQEVKDEILEASKSALPDKKTTVSDPESIIEQLEIARDQEEDWVKRAKIAAQIVKMRL